MIHGVVAADENGVQDRLGFFTDNQFSTVGDTFSGTKGFSHTFSFAPTNVTVRPVRDTFVGFDGDLNADETLCWSDRHLFQTLVGFDINDAEYNARADFDLDGDIDSNDFAAFLVLFNANACTADYDCSGAVNSTDYFNFTNDFQNLDPKADFNGNGVVNSQDWNDFLNAFFAGC